MSEEINVQSQHFCTTEDAFEQFQAGAMYEEDEYITLSDLVSPPDNKDDAVDALIDMPSDEVTSTQDQVQEVNNVVDLDINKILTRASESTVTQHQTALVDVKFSKKIPNKRGRKKKTFEDSSSTLTTLRGNHQRTLCPTEQSITSTNANDDIDYSMVIGEEDDEVDLLGTLQTSYKKPRRSKKSVTKINKGENSPRKRGRPKKIPVMEKCDDSIKEMTYINNNATINEGSNSETSAEVSQIKTNGKVQRRGRKKRKVSSEVTSTYNIEHGTNTESLSSSVIEKDVSSETMIQEKCSLSLKDELKNKIQECDNDPTVAINISGSGLQDKDFSEEEDLPLMTISKIKQSCKADNNQTNIGSNINETTSHNETSNACKTAISPSKRRGRPKKNITNIKLKEVKTKKEYSVIENESENIFLNTLKETTQPNPEVEQKNALTTVIQTDLASEAKRDDTLIEGSTKRSIKMPVMVDFEYNIDSIIDNNKKEESIENKSKELQESYNEDLLVEGSAKRPVRRKAKKTLRYDEESDEDPFANVELSDDEPRRGKKGGRYYSDDEYIPGSKRGKQSVQSDSTDSEVDSDEGLEFDKNSKRKKSSPKKKCLASESSYTPDVTTIKPKDVDDDIEICLETSVIKANDELPSSWGKTSVFENFIAKKIHGTDIKIKKGTSDNAITPFQIPVLDPNERKTVEMCSQTTTIATKTATAQTDSVYEIPMEQQITLTPEQSKKACEFLSNIVKTTAELGQLMTQKSEDFITKKINTNHVVDTFKMDYCVKKSFLLFKLAKHNLMQMEQDLSKQYEDFLRANDLLQYREEQKTMMSTAKPQNNDSDCEIVEEQPPTTSSKQQAFNPRTVFLNKELSIKIAKKPTASPKPKEKLNVKGRHTVWINDSIMVKKVKPNQSFLSQDSRNKKPPDTYVTLKMVNGFFSTYNRKQALRVCAPFINSNSYYSNKEYVCCYFVEKTIKTTDEPIHIEEVMPQNTETTSSDMESTNHLLDLAKRGITINPKSLLDLCLKVLQNKFHAGKDLSNELNNGDKYLPQIPLKSQVLLKCTQTYNEQVTYLSENKINSKKEYQKIEVLSLVTLCHKKIMELVFKSNCMKPEICHDENKVFYHTDKIKTLFSLCVEFIQSTQILSNKQMHISVNTNTYEQLYKPKTLKCIVLDKVNELVDDKHRRSFEDSRLLKCLALDKKNKITEVEEDNLTSICSDSFTAGMCKYIKHLVFDEVNRITENKLTSSCRDSHTVHKSKSLICLVLDKVNKMTKDKLTSSCSDNITVHKSKSLKCIVLDKINKIIKDKQSINCRNYLELQECKTKSLAHICLDFICTHIFKDSQCERSLLKHKNGIQTFHDNILNQERIESFFVSSLKVLSLRKLAILLHEPSFYETCNKKIFSGDLGTESLNLNNNITIVNNLDLLLTNYPIINGNSDKEISLVINDVNTVTEDDFNQNFQDFDEEDDYDPQYEAEEDIISNDFEHNPEEHILSNIFEQNTEEENNWVAKVQMKELRSCIEAKHNNEPEIEENDNVIINIKKEPLEVANENISDSTSIKVEPIDVLSEDNITSIPIVTKTEYCDRVTANAEPIVRQNSNSYDVDAFEAFVSSNKIIRSIFYEGEEENGGEIFSQSALRVRRQHEPDSDEDLLTSADGMCLLIPQNVEQAKDRLMQLSSDEESHSKINDKKKPMKRKGKYKKNNKETPPANEKPTVANDVAILTRRMKEKIRQEENKDKEDEVSDTEDIPLSLRKEKESTKDKCSKEKIVNNKPAENEIQCNDVDSTENITYTNSKETEIIKRSGKNKKRNNNTEEYKSTESILTTTEENKTIDDRISQFSDNDERPCSPLISLDNPEMLECEPILPFLDTEENENDLNELEKVQDEIKKFENLYTVRNGWNCYTINKSDVKIYKYACVNLEKLPESFVETYFRYQEITDRTEDDTEIDRLTNLQSLHRTQSKEKNRKEEKIKDNTILDDISKSETVKHSNLVHDSTETDNQEELSPSEDERDDTEELPSVPGPSSENYLAKNLLMNDNDSDSEKLELNKKGDLLTIEIKKETEEESTNPEEIIKPRPRPGPKSKTRVEKKETVIDDSVMLTADIMMNKELTLLHAPVALKEEPMLDIKDKDIGKKPVTRNSTKQTTKSQIASTIQVKAEDDSSSEEEKQWFTTKEKLLKRLEKKQENASVDDVRRAKIVSEFIVKRSDGPVGDVQRLTGRPRRPRSKKKLLERRKQMKVLSRELFGEDTSQPRKYSQAYGKGRRNIRKVIDKKSLARSTLLANMEEFERKQRLTIRQGELRQVLGCEDDVNVVVINDELCLEYDFTENMPMVTVHPDFTKVMKAHQYEGVKFMWDACFESLEMVESGRPGGGCILAHCMGLGKTLQVLALLHTVLSHPRVGMRRVLVCCPLSTVLNWVDEINKWIRPVTDKIKVFELSKLKKIYERAYQLEDWYNGGGIFIIGYELFRSLTTLDPILDDVRPTIVNKIRTALLDPGPDIVICDEGHLLKNDLSILAVAMSRVVTRRRIMLTGTPMQNNLREYYCMVNFVKPNLLGTYSEFSNRFENPIMNGQHRDSQEDDIKLMKARTHILHKVLEGCLQRQEASVLYPYLPKKYEYTVFISLTKCQWDLYKHYLENYAKGPKHSVLKDFHVLQKIWSHPQVLHIFQTRAREVEDESKIKAEKCEDDLARADLAASEDVKPPLTSMWWLPHVEDGQQLDALHSSNKFLVVFRLLDECVALGDKVLIFSTSLYTMDSLEYFLRKINKWSLGQEYYRLDGSVPAEVRQKWCREFNAENNTKTRLFLISTRAGCLGLNMTAANRVIILDTSWNPAHDIQSIFRVYRFGQKKDCYIYRLVALGTMEQKIYERSVTKQAVACRVVDEQQIDRHYNMSDLNELYRWDEEGTTVGAGLAAGVRDAALLRVAAALGDCTGAAPLHAVREHDSLLRDSSEKNLPEHERAAAWHQFEQEHSRQKMQHLEINIPKISTGDHNYTQHAETITPQTGTAEPKPTKGRKGARSSVGTVGDPIQPSTSQQNNYVLDPNKEQTMIDKIRSLLIQHNVDPKGGIAELVEKVRNFIDSPKKPGRSAIKKSDPLVESIARVLLQEVNPQMPIPALTDVYPQTLVKTEEPELIVGDTEDRYIIPNDESTLEVVQDETTSVNGERKRRRHKRDSDDEYVPEPNRRKKKPETRKSIPVDNGFDLTYNNKIVEEYLLKNKKLQDNFLEERLCSSSDAVVEDKSQRNRRSTNSVADDSLRDKITSDIIIEDDSLKNKISTVNILQNNSRRGRKSNIQEESVSRSTDNVANNSRKTRRSIDIVGENDTRKIKRSKDITENNSYNTRKSNILRKSKVNEDDSQNNFLSKSGESIPNNLIVSDTSNVLNVSQDTMNSKLKEKLKKEKGPGKRSKQTIPIISKESEHLSVNTVTIDDSILLSDDDESVPQVLAAAASKCIIKPVEERNSTKEINTNTEAIPLHRSLLSNPNFIKIVAHTYLSNNPIMDEDAATLAARYSTSKALKEVESTGKDIYSGPIYDIAEKVLGMQLMKKLNTASAEHKDLQGKVTTVNTNLENEPKDVRESYDTSTDVADVMPENALKVKKKPRPACKSLTKNTKNQDTLQDLLPSFPISEATTSTSASIAPEPAAQTPSQSVVPVGMFLGPSKINVSDFVPETLEESILPDDDDILIIPYDTPLVQQPELARRRSKPLILNSVTADNASSNESKTIISMQPMLPATMNPRLLAPSQIYTTEPAFTFLPTLTPVSIQSAQMIVAASPETVLPATNEIIEAAVPSIVPTPTEQAVYSANTRTVQLATAPVNRQIAPQTFKLVNTSDGQKIIIDNRPVKDESTPVVRDLANNSVKPVQNTLISGDTICLDSDDDEVPNNQENEIKSITVSQTITKTPPRNISKQSNVTETVPLKSDVPNVTTKILPIISTDSKSGKKVVVLSQKSVDTPKHILNNIKAAVPNNVAEKPKKKANTVVAMSNRTTCIPGDVIRISETGQIEVLKRTDRTSTSNVAVVPANKNVQKKAKPQSILLKALAPNAIIEETVSSTANSSCLTSRNLDVSTPIHGGTQSSNLTRTSFISNDTDSTDVVSLDVQELPSDPMSIFDNVVQIQADEYEKVTNKTTQPKSSIKIQQSNSSTRIQQSKSLTKSQQSNSSIKTVPVPTSPKNDKLIETVTADVSKNAKALSKIMNELKNFTVKSMSKIKENKSTEQKQQKPIAKNSKLQDIISSKKSTEKKTPIKVNFDSFATIDLTDNIESSSGSKSKIATSIQKAKEIVQRPKTSFTKTTGTSKDIVITNAGKLSSIKQQSATSSTKVGSSQTFKASPATPSTSGKRATPWLETSLTKKLKNDTNGVVKPTKPLMLQDFDVDDIGDIIELE